MLNATSAGKMWRFGAMKTPAHAPNVALNGKNLMKTPLALNTASTPTNAERSSIQKKPRQCHGFTVFNAKIHDNYGNKAANLYCLDI